MRCVPLAYSSGAIREEVALHILKLKRVYRGVFDAKIRVDGVTETHCGARFGVKCGSVIAKRLRTLVGGLD
jgi:hypothetical protein